MFQAIRSFFSDEFFLIIVVVCAVAGIIGVGAIGTSYNLGYSAAEHDWRRHVADVKNETKKYEQLLEKREEIKEHIAKARIEYLENELFAARENFKENHDALVRLAEDLKRERQLLTLVDDYLKDVDPDALEALRREVR